MKKTTLFVVLLSLVLLLLSCVKADLCVGLVCSCDRISQITNCMENRACLEFLTNELGEIEVINADTFLIIMERDGQFTTFFACNPNNYVIEDKKEIVFNGGIKAEIPNENLPGIPFVLTWMKSR